MGWIFFAMFVIVPLVEIFLFLQVGAFIGLWPTLGIVILTAIIGSMLLRHQGLATLFKAEAKLRAGELPMEQMVDGLCLAFAGALLLTPGFFTDAFGFLLFIPLFRRAFANFFFEKFVKVRISGFSKTGGHPPHGHYGDTTGTPFEPDVSDKSGPIIEGTYSSKDRGSNEGSGKDKPSPWHDKQ